MRLFISIELPEEIKRELIRIQKEIDLLGLIKGKFTDPDNLHLTLKFLGEVGESEVMAVKERLKNLKFQNFKMTLSNLGVFSEKFIRISWVGFESKELFELQKQIDDALEGIFPKEHRFMAHVTLARPKYIEDRMVFLEEFKKIPFEKKSFNVGKISLRSAVLNKYGADYQTIENYFSLKEELMLTN